MDETQTRRYLDKQPREKIAAMKRPHIIKKFMKIYNSICKDCRREVIKYPTKKLEDFCQPCQEKIKKIWGD